MRRYLRTRLKGGTYFFTLGLEHRQDNRLLVDQVGTLREAVRVTRRDHPFMIDAMVVLPDHIHAIWTLPEGDADYSTRWSLIKARFSRKINRDDWVSSSRLRRRERGIWQRRFYEHAIRDERDMENHINYVHWNPVKHLLVDRAADWPHSSFHRYVRLGLLPLDWAQSSDVQSMELD